jgi:hypothetical protein
VKGGHSAYAVQLTCQDVVLRRPLLRHSSLHIHSRSAQPPCLLIECQRRPALVLKIAKEQCLAVDVHRSAPLVSIGHPSHAPVLRRHLSLDPSTVALDELLQRHAVQLRATLIWQLEVELGV